MKTDHPSEKAYRRSAEALGCEVAAIKAVAEVEAGREGAFLPSGEPVCLYEPHVFHRLTNGRFSGATAEPGIDSRFAELSYPKWRRGTYGPVSIQHRKLAAAAALDRDAALRATSWGLFQILGDNFKAAGFSTLQHFVNAMYRSADDHLLALTSFILSNPRLAAALRALDWPTVAELYNGKGYRLNRYDVRMAAAYQKHLLSTT